MADTIARTVKARGEEIARSYDAELGKTEDQLKKVKAKREKARNQGIKGRIAEDTQSLSKENEELKGRIRTLSGPIMYRGTVPEVYTIPFILPGA